MKRIFATFIILFCALHGRTQVRLAVEAGLLNSSYDHNKDLTGAGSFKPGNGFTAGASACYRIFRQLSGVTGVAYQKRQLHYTSAPMPDNMSVLDYQLRYLVFSQNFMVMTRAVRGFSFGTGTGIYFARALNGTYKGTASTFGGQISQSGDVKFGNDNNDDFKRSDIGMNILVRSQYKSIHLTMQYSPSFSNSNPGENSQPYKFRCLALSLGYIF